MAKIGLPKGFGKRLKVREKSVKKSGNFEMDIEWQPCGNIKISFVIEISLFCRFLSGRFTQVLL